MPFFPYYFDSIEVTIHKLEYYSHHVIILVDALLSVTFFIKVTH